MSADRPTEVEEWKQVPGYEGIYSVSNLGRLRRDARCPTRFPGTIFTGCPNKKGYFKVRLRKDGNTGLKSVARTVLEAFVGIDPQRPEANHKFGIKSDNRLSQLEWSTHKENEDHARFFLQTTTRGETVNTCKLTAAKVVEIRERYANGELQIHLCKEFGVTQGAITKIVLRRNWKHVK